MTKRTFAGRRFRAGGGERCGRRVRRRLRRGARARADCASSAVAPLKVCVFADLHYRPGKWTNTENTSFLEAILERAERERCDFIIHLGDFMHGVKSGAEKAHLKLYNDFKILGYHILGNHDQDGNSWRETCDAYRMPDGHYFFEKGGFRFVVLDPNYFCNEPGVSIHHENGDYFKRAKNSTINWIPPHEMEWLRDAILNSSLPCVVLSHQSLERGNGAPVMNAREVCEVFNEANRRRPGAVRLTMNGHMHCDNLRILDNILYWDVNSANYYGKKHSKHPKEYIAAHTGAANNIGWTKPLSAVLSLWPDGRIKIDGSEADWLFGVSPADAGYPAFDCDGRETLPLIRSCDITPGGGMAA